MSDGGAKSRHSGDNVHQQQQQQRHEQQCNGILRSNMSDWAKKEEIAKRKNLRLQQVREQSKEIASQIRDRVRDEKDRQVQVANATKQNELLNWQQRQMDKTSKDYKACLSKVGEAHLAAQTDAAKAKLIEQQKIKNRQLAIRRGKVAAERELTMQEMAIKKMPSRADKSKRKHVSVSTQVNDSVNSSNMSCSSSTSSLSSSTSSALVDIDLGGNANGAAGVASNSRTMAEKLQSKYLPKTVQKPTIASSDEESDLEISTILSAQNKNKKKSVSYDLSLIESDRNRNDMSLTDNYDSASARPKQPQKYIDWNAKDSFDTSLTQPTEVPTITRVSDLLKKSRNNENNINLISAAFPKSSLHKKGGNTNEFVPMQQQKPPKPTIINAKERAKSPQSILKKPKTVATSPKPQPKPILKQPQPTNKLQKTPKKSAVKQTANIEKRQQTPFHFVPRFVTNKQTTDEASAPSVQMQKVQFYDHANRFGKEYELHTHLVHREFGIGGAEISNAMEEAKTETALEQKRLLELAEARKVDEIRAKQAFEKEKIRKDYELMQAQLEVLTQQENHSRIHVNSNELFSEHRIQQTAEEHQRKMNLEFQSALNEPVLITCPKIAPKVNNISESSSSELNVASEMLKNPAESTRTENKLISGTQTISDRSTESYSSFLLDYVNARSEDILKDIGNRNQNAPDGGKDNITALQNLLTKVDGLKYLLQEAIKTHQGTNNEQLKQNMKFVLKELEQVEREETQLKSNNRQTTSHTKNIIVNKNKGTVSTATNESDISLREKMLKFKEQCFDDKLRELYLHEKKMKRDAQQMNAQKEKRTNDVVAINQSPKNDSSVSDSPVRIVINVNQKNRNKTTRSTELKWSERLKNPIQNESTRDLAILTKVTDEAGASFRKTPAKISKKVVTNIEQTSSTSTTLTAYLSPPEEINTALTEALKANKPKQPHLAPQSSANAEADSQLAQYILRLLAMSRNSIDQLGISSVSTVATPNSSVIDGTANASTQRQLATSGSSETDQSSSLEIIKRPAIDEQKMEQLQQFIADNHNLVEELNNSLKSLKMPPNESDQRKMENVWMEILKDNQKQTKHTDPSKSVVVISQNDPKQPESILKPSTKSQPKQTDLITKYDELTATCAKRITDLNSMIFKVREEKQKLLENTLSSAGSLISGQIPRENFTEYLDFAQQQNQNQQGDTSQGSDIKSLQTPSPEYSSSSGAAAVAGIIANPPALLHSKQIGISKDSGVGASRPVTSSDFRDSPEFKPSESINASAANKSTDAGALPKADSFEPMLKDIPRGNYRLVDLSGNASTGLTQESEEILTEIIVETDNSKAKYPPAALTRYSPQLEDDRVHELSTITEVDTPGTSRINATITHNESTTANKTNANIVELFYNRFPAFSEYAQAHNLDMSVDTSGSMLNITAAVNALLGDRVLDIDGSQLDALKYRSFHESHKSLSSTAANMEYMRFLPHTDYARNVPGLLDSRSLEGLLSMEIDAPVNLTQTQNTEERNDSSLVDIIGELKKRNLMKEALALASVRSSTDDLRKKQTASGTNSSSTSVDALEKELQKMGINWASTMLKKSKETNALSSSSSSKSSAHDISGGNRRRSIKPGSPSENRKPKIWDNSKMMGVNSFLDPELTAIERETPANASKAESLNATETKPVNLKQFLARELMKHSSTSSSSSIDSSLASIYLKSFIGTPSNPSTPATATRSQSHEKQRTSTPVNVSGLGATRVPSADGQKNGSTEIQQNYESGNLTDRLFSGESHLSSVRSHVSETDITFGSKEPSFDEEEKHKQFEAKAIPANLHLNLATHSQQPGFSNSS